MFNSLSVPHNDPNRSFCLICLVNGRPVWTVSTLIKDFVKCRNRNFDMLFSFLHVKYRNKVFEKFVLFLFSGNVGFRLRLSEERTISESHGLSFQVQTAFRMFENFRIKVSLHTNYKMFFVFSL